MFRALLAVLWIVLATYTAAVVAHNGVGLFAIFFGDIARVGWPGQFNLDFLFMLLLSAIWVSWRHRYSASGLLLGAFAFVGGSGFLLPYLLVLSVTTGANAERMLVGDRV
jgi:hypothetical protein